MEKSKYYEVLDLTPIIYVNDSGEKCVEKWKTVPNYTNYEVSDLGRVKSIDRITFDINGIKYNRFSKVLSPSFNEKGYLNVNIKRDDGKYKTNRPHRLVMLAFIGESNLEVDHINQIKWDNRLSNLRYCTTRENSHFYRSKLNTSSNYIGVTKSRNKYCANIRIGKESFYLGTFETQEQANEVYIKVLYNWENFNIRPIPVEKNYTSKQKGVTWIKRSQRWCSRIFIEGKRVHIGHYKTEIEAIDAYLKAEYNWKNYQKYPPKATFTSKYKGVFWDRASDRWKAFIRKNGNSVQIGSSKTEEGAYEILLKYIDIKKKTTTIANI